MRAESLMVKAKRADIGSREWITGFVTSPYMDNLCHFNGEIIFLDGLWYIDGHVQNALYDINRCFQIEVRGNAFDNPELLQEEDHER